MCSGWCPRPRSQEAGLLGNAGALGHRRNHKVPLPGSFWDPGLPRACRVTDHSPRDLQLGTQGHGAAPGGWVGGAAKPRGDLGSSWKPAFRKPLAGVCPGLEGTFGGGEQDERALGRRAGLGRPLVGCGVGGSEDPHMLPKCPGRQWDPAVSIKAEDAGRAESIPKDGPSPVGCLDRTARSEDRDQLKAREPGGSRETSLLAPSPCPPHSVLGAQHPFPSLMGLRTHAPCLGPR